jgi:hypothetical protein
VWIGQPALGAGKEHVQVAGACREPDPAMPFGLPSVEFDRDMFAVANAALASRSNRMSVVSRDLLLVNERIWE